MQPRVTAILVAHGASESLARTAAALSTQTRRADVVVAIDVAPTDASTQQLQAAAPTLLLTARPGTSFGGAVTQAVATAPPSASDNEWLWLLASDNTPEPDALENLLAAIEIAPSVVVAGPKLMRADDPTTLDSFGETITTFGATVDLVSDELDQGQYDTRDDVLAVAAGGMLVRRSVWAQLGGFDPGLPSIDASLDFCIRARLAGHRVILVPRARVASAGGPELFGRRTSSARRRFRLARTAALHRRLVYAPAWAVPLHWLSLLPLALLRAVGQLIAKRPGFVGTELAAAVSAAFDGGVASARRNLRRTRSLGWAAIAELRMPLADVRERRAQAREIVVVDRATGTPVAARAGFITGGGLWVTLAMALVGVIAYLPLLGTGYVVGGGLLPLSGTVSELWSNVGYGWRGVGMGFEGAADPFAAVLAVLGTLTFWSPSYSIVLLYLGALPLAALGAWFFARSITRSRWLPALAAVLWALAPTLLASLADGRPGAIIAQILLPWLAFALLSSARSWSASAAAALLLAAIGASAPVLVPALLVLWLLWLLSHPTRIHRLIGIPIPLAALFAPLAVQQFARGNPLALLSDPGRAIPGGSAPGWRFALGDANGRLHGWADIADSLGWPALAAPLIVTVLVAPLIVLALLALFLPHGTAAIPATVAALLGFVTAVASAQLEVASVGAQPVMVWPGSGIALFWLGLIAAAVVALDGLGRAAEPVAVFSGLTLAAVSVPLLGALLVGTAAIAPSTGRILPALVTALADKQPDVGTLLLTATDDGVVVDLQRGAGDTLDDQSTLANTARQLTPEEQTLAVLAGNLTSRSGFDTNSELSRLAISFVVLNPDGGSADGAERHRITDALGANDNLTAVGMSEYGQLWRFDGELAELPDRDGNGDTRLGTGILIGQGIVFGITALLALPFGGRRRVHADRASDDPAETFESDDDG